MIYIQNIIYSYLAKYIVEGGAFYSCAYLKISEEERYKIIDFLVLLYDIHPNCKTGQVWNVTVPSQAYHFQNSTWYSPIVHDIILNCSYQ